MEKYDGLICGDSDVIVDEMISKGEKFDLILTDPPYNINKDFGNDSDKLSVAEFVRITNERVKKYKQLLTPTGSILWFGIHDYVGYIQIAMYDAGLYYRRINIWHYGNGRYVRKRLEEAEMNLAERCFRYDAADMTDEFLTTIEAEDIPETKFNDVSSKIRIGFAG